MDPNKTAPHCLPMRLRIFKWTTNNTHFVIMRIFQPILMILVSKFMVHRALSYKTYLSLGLLSPLRVDKCEFSVYTVRIS